MGEKEETGIVSMVLGLLLAPRLGSGPVVVVLFNGGSAIVFGILLIVLGFRLRGLCQG